MVRSYRLHLYLPLVSLRPYCILSNLFVPIKNTLLDPQSCSNFSLTSCGIPSLQSGQCAYGGDGGNRTHVQETYASSLNDLGNSIYCIVFSNSSIQGSLLAGSTRTVPYRALDDRCQFCAPHQTKKG